MSPRPKTYSSTSMRFSMHVILEVTKPYFFHKLPKVTNQTFTKNKYYKSPLKKNTDFFQVTTHQKWLVWWRVANLQPMASQKVIWQKWWCFLPNGRVTQPQVAGNLQMVHIPLKNVPEGYKTLGEIWRLDTQKTKATIWQHDIPFEKGLIRSGFQQSMRHRCEQTEMLQLRRAKASRVDDPEA